MKRSVLFGLELIGLDLLNQSTGRFPEEGYVVVPGILTAPEAAALHDALGVLFERAPMPGPRRTLNERILLSDARFLDVVTRPALIEPLRRTLGDDVQILAYDALEWAPHSGSEREWHADFDFFTDSVLTVNVGIYLSDMTNRMGPLYVIPGSHRRRRRPNPDEQGVSLDGELRVSVPAGTAVIFNAQLWHSGSRNETDRPRRALFSYCGHYWLKRQDAFYSQPLPESVLGSGDPLVRQLFGLASKAVSPHGAAYNADNPHWTAG